MIIVLGTIEVDVADRQRYLEEKVPQVESTLGEPGCLDYCFAADGRDPSGVRLVERWASMADLEAHVARLRAAPAPVDLPVPSRMVAIDLFEAEPAQAPWA